MADLKRLLITGAAGFIGSNFVRYELSRYSDLKIIGLDKLTYAGSKDNLAHVDQDGRFTLYRGDICDSGLVSRLLEGIDGIVNFAADSMVDRSIGDSKPFLDTNFSGVDTLI